MTSHPPSLAEHFAGLRAALQPQTGELRPHAGALDVMLLTLLSALLGRLARLARAWHPAPTQEDSDQEAQAPLFPVALLYLFGPRRNRGMRSHARTTPIARPRTARAPPFPRRSQTASTHTPHSKTAPTGAAMRRLFHYDIISFH